MNMRNLLLLSMVLTMGVATAMAVPAKPGVKKTFTLKDGTRVEATLAGDEYVHFYQTADNRAIQFRDGAYEYVDRDSLVQLHRHRLAASNKRRAERASRVGQRPEGGIKGQRRGLVIMVEFSDVKFTYTKENYNDYFNKVGYNFDGMAGSVHDYFLAQSYGQFDLEFDIVGPIAVNREASYYGHDLETDESNDTRVALMVNTLCRQVDSQVDFSQYDWDDDGYVDQVYVIYAGYGAAQGANHTIWPHESSVRAGTSNPYKTAEGVTIETYAISCELRGNGTNQPGHIDGVGTSCHEFSHCLGLPDFYDTKNQKNFGMSQWDLMDSGCYNGNSNGTSPVGYTAYERWFAGWLEPIELTSSQQIVDMPAIQDEPLAYIIYNDAYPNEYYMLENFQQKGFDSASGGHGLLVLHVDYSAGDWGTNKVNVESSHQRMTIVPADNNYSVKSLSGDPFPGARFKTELTNTSSPRASLYNANADGKKLMNKPITEISEFKGKITFNFMGGVEVQAPVATNPTAVMETGFTAKWSPIEGASDYTVSLTQHVEGDDEEISVVFEEDFEAFKADYLTSNIAGMLDNYTNLPGWSGKNLYASPYKLRVGKSTSLVGELKTPWFDAPDRDTLSLFIAPISEVSGNSLQLRIYASNGGYLYVDLRDIPLLESADAGTSWVIYAPWSYGNFQVAVYPNDLHNGVYMDYLAAVEGKVEVEDEEDSAPALAPGHKVGSMSVVEPQWKQVGLETSAPRPRKAKQQDIVTFFTTTDTFYSFSDLEPGVYSYKVRANTEAGNVSPWSNEVTVDLVTGIRPIADDEMVNGKCSNGKYYYDLRGRRIANPVRGLYIHDGRKVVVK